MRCSIETVPVLNDNYAYVLCAAEGETTLVVDPGEPGPVLEFLRARGRRLTHILNTHHHGDHVGGNLDLLAAYACSVIGGEHDRRRIPGLTQTVADKEIVDLGGLRFQALHVPGHTLGAVGYWFMDEDALFTGDTLFSLGCGRLFEGSPEQMWTSLCRLKGLPPQTRVYCGHEYTLGNARFAQSLTAADSNLETFVAGVSAKRAQAQPSVPSLLQDECAFNPFLRVDDTEFVRAADLPEEPVAAFAALRSRKDRFR